MEDKKINFSINEGESFFAHEISVSFNPTQFIFDFKCITPRVDPRSNEGQVLNIKHNVVMMDTHHAKKFMNFLKARIDDYEKEFGKVEVPKVLKQLEKKQKNKPKKSGVKKIEAPQYFG